MNRSLRRWVWFGVIGLALGLLFYNLSRSDEWRNFSWPTLWSLIDHAHPAWLLGALAATYATYLVRAYRWKFFLDPIKKAPLWVLFVGQIYGFSSIYLIGRPGEIVRPAYIAKKTDVPLISMMAVWLLERIYDTGFLVLLFAIAVSQVPMHPRSRRAHLVIALHHSGPKGLAIFALLIAVLVLFRLRTEKATAVLLKLFAFLPARGREQMAKFLRSFSAGLEVIQNWRDFTGSIVSSVVLWVLNVSVMWLVLESLGGELARLSWLAAAVVLFGAAVALVVQLPGIGGGFQVGAILALRELFGLGVESATSAAILVWIMISVPCLALGLVLLAYEGLTFRKLGAMAKQEAQAMSEKI